MGGERVRRGRHRAVKLSISWFCQEWAAEPMPEVVAFLAISAKRGGCGGLRSMKQFCNLLVGPPHGIPAGNTISIFCNSSEKNLSLFETK